MLHGDGVPCTNYGSLDVLSWESISARSSEVSILSSLDSIFYIIGIFSQAFVSDGDITSDWRFGRTKDHLWKLILESFKFLESGYYNGKSIAGNYRSVLWAIKGDAEFCVNFIELPGHWPFDFPCISCQARSKPIGHDLHYLNFERHAGWKAIQFDDMDTWYSYCRYMNKRIHPLFAPGKTIG